MQHLRVSDQRIPSGDSEPVSLTDSDAHSYTYSNTHAHSGADGFPDTIAHTDASENRYPHSGADGNANSDTNPDAADAAPGSRTGQSAGGYPGSSGGSSF